MSTTAPVPPVPTEECDLVMKGGVTSGVVYPRAIQEVARRYRLRNLGGASAGAIAAVAAAACEYRRNQGEAAAYDRLDDVTREITQPGFVLGLFQPTPAARPAFEIALRFTTSGGSLTARSTAALIAILRGRGLFLGAAVAALVLWAAALVVLVWALLDGGVGWMDGVALALLAAVALLGVPGTVALVALVAVTRFAVALQRALDANGVGMCSGMTESGNPPGSGLTDWLHATIQHCAGLPLDRPLTFGMLRGDDADNPLVSLALVTTDLSSSRPVTLPLPEPEEEEAPYLFDPEELGRLFPPEVVEQLKTGPADKRRTHVEDGVERTLYPVPGAGMPVVVAARLSLSFPILLSTVPLWRDDPGVKDVVRHTMSDGGICSNFPIHFFDSLLPSRPTFGLDLQPWRTPGLPPVELSDAPRKPQFARAVDTLGFFPRLLNAARNWRDNMQAELPGYRDRICQIRLSSKEGGLNLNMPDDVVAALVERGRDAGQEIVGAGFDWDRHRVTRYQILMQMLQRGLGRPGVGRDGVYRGPAAGGRVPFRDVVEEWSRAGQSPLERPSLEWLVAALAASDELVELAGRWGPPDLDFDRDAPTPTPAIRVVPRV